MGRRRAEPTQWPPERWPPWVIFGFGVVTGSLAVAVLLMVVKWWLPVLFAQW